MKIAPAPAHIAHRLELIDQRSISNVADATNYVLNEIGQPTHAFDLDKLEGGKIIVRRARAGETLITLDGSERKLSPEDLVIADAVKPVALAGIMGGEATMITYATKTCSSNPHGSIRRPSDAPPAALPCTPMPRTATSAEPTPASRS